MRFQALIKMLFLIERGHTIHYQQPELSRFLTRFQQFASLAYFGAARSVSKMASEQEKPSCVLRFNVCRSVITVQCEFRTRFKQVIILCVASFFKPCTKLTLHCNHRSGHNKTGHTGSLLLLRRHLGNWSRDPAVSMRSELLVARKKLRHFSLLTVYVVTV
jgi:hypothetical protein